MFHFNLEIRLQFVLIISKFSIQDKNVYIIIKLIKNYERTIFSKHPKKSVIAR